MALLSAILIRLNSKTTALFYLGLFLLNICFLTVLCFIYLEVGTSAVLQLRGFQNLSFLALGPCLYFYLKFNFIPNYQYTKKDYLNVVPFIISFLIVLPFSIQSYESRFYDFYGPLGFTAITLVRFFTILTLFFYLALCFRLIKKHEATLAQIFSNAISVKMCWSYILLGALCLLWLLMVIMTLFGVNQIAVTFSMEACVIIFFVIGIYSHMHSQFLLMNEDEKELVRAKHLETEVPNNNSLVPQTETVALKNGSGEKYKTSPLDKIQLGDHLKKIEQLIENQPELFLKSSLQLSELAKRMNLPPYLASQVINEGLNKNFYDLVNEQRIKKAKKLLVENGRSNLSILEIAYEVGYNSKSTFNSSFKKYTGMTPTQFKKFNLSK